MSTRRFIPSRKISTIILTREIFANNNNFSTFPELIMFSASTSLLDQRLPFEKKEEKSIDPLNSLFNCFL